MNLDVKKSRKGKRGRKSTSKIISLENDNNINTDNMMIAHLPLDEETINKYLKEDEANDKEDNNKIDIFFDKNQKVSNTKITKLYKEIDKLKKELKTLKNS